MKPGIFRIRRLLEILFHISVSLDIGRKPLRFSPRESNGELESDRAAPLASPIAIVEYPRPVEDNEQDHDSCHTESQKLGCVFIVLLSQYFGAAAFSLAAAAAFEEIFAIMGD
jgi:hypothetical protein